MVPGEQKNEGILSAFAPVIAGMAIGDVSAFHRYKKRHRRVAFGHTDILGTNKCGNFWFGSVLRENILDGVGRHIADRVTKRVEEGRRNGH